MYENFELLANAIILQAVRDYRHTYSPQVRAEIKHFFRSEWFRALTRVDGEASFCSFIRRQISLLQQRKTLR